jgi:hypothetical protein
MAVSPRGCMCVLNGPADCSLVLLAELFLGHEIIWPNINYLFQFIPLFSIYVYCIISYKLCI